MPRHPTKPRFFSKVQVTANAECMRWLGTHTRDGYGAFRHNGSMTSAHRVAYELLVGAIPQGYEIDHLCRNRGCVNPDHLEPVTPFENKRRASAGRPNIPATECPSGHVLTAETAYVAANGVRKCRPCNAAAAARYKARRTRALSGAEGARR